MIYQHEETMRIISEINFDDALLLSLKLDSSFVRLEILSQSVTMNSSIIAEENFVPFCLNFSDLSDLQIAYQCSTFPAPPPINSIGIWADLGPIESILVTRVKETEFKSSLFEFYQKWYDGELRFKFGAVHTEFGNGVRSADVQIT